jgi:shikimate kinase
MISDTPKQSNLIFLIGFMGCGKTTLAKKLANRLGYHFIDLDHVLENQVDMSIADYFALHGETKFRELESQVLKQTEYPQNAIVSTGGGLPCFFDHMNWMNSHGQTLYISLAPKALAARLDNGKSTRPVLQGKHGDELIEFIEQKLAEREPFYNRATITINGLGINLEELAEMLLT